MFDKPKMAMALLFCLVPVATLCVPASYGDNYGSGVSQTTKEQIRDNQLNVLERTKKSNAWGAPKIKDGDDLVLREPMDLQDLPKFTGHADFLRGKVRTTEAGTACHMAWNCKESREQVMDWYNSVLSMNQWKVFSKNSEIVMARKGPNQCTIGVFPNFKDKKYPCNLSINYFLSAKQQ
jgi:hypothetical protein